MNALLKNSKNFDMTYAEKHDSSKVVMGYGHLSYMAKRFIDYSLVLLAGVFVLPFVLYSVYRIKKESPGPVFFTQMRVGANGKPFKCYKFRSMRSEPKSYPKVDKLLYTQDNDSRIFPYGHTMRKMRIDELPQLINVLKGDMHFVGPRAEWDILVDRYEKVINNYHARHSVKPGITGLAQVRYPYGRDVNDSKKKLKYDLFYIQKWSPLLEISVLFQTVFVVFKKSGV